MDALRIKIEMGFLPLGAAELANMGPEERDSHGGGATYTSIISTESADTFR